MTENPQLVFKLKNGGDVFQYCVCFKILYK